MFVGTTNHRLPIPLLIPLYSGVVVENFSYVFQTSRTGSKSISREQMRSFKKVWAAYSNPKTGYLERPNFAAFFSVSYFLGRTSYHELKYLLFHRSSAGFLNPASIQWNSAFGISSLLAKLMTLRQRFRALTWTSCDLS